MQQKDFSPNQKALRRLRANRPAMFGVGLIVLSVTIAILGYAIAPDATPDVNDQNPILALKNVGFSVKTLSLRKNRVIETRNFFSKMFFGSPNPYETLRINQYEIRQDSIFVEKYLGENPTTGELLRGGQVDVHLADVTHGIASAQPKIVKVGTKYQFLDEKNEAQQIERAAIVSEIEKKLVCQKNFWLGTDNFGRDILSRLLLGVRVSLIVGLIAVVISLTIGVLLGAIAGFFGGRTDDAIMLIINTIWSIPTILLVFAIVLAFGRGIGIIFFAVGLTMWVDVARLVRGQVMSLKEMQYIEATRALGYGKSRVILRHILPNILGPVMVMAASNFATAILIESGLSYLGFGIQPPTPSWGTMLNENYGFAIGGKPFLALAPALAIMLMVLAFNLVGNGFRDALDVKSKD
jgi:peptide/nickel transport system permease protein